jgi:hypothetical protein
LDAKTAKVGKDRFTSSDETRTSVASQTSTTFVEVEGMISIMEHAARHRLILSPKVLTSPFLAFWMPLDFQSSTKTLTSFKEHTPCCKHPAKCLET